MSRLTTIAAAVLFLTVGAAAAAPITKQNGKNPVFKDFTSICAVSGYASYGLCNGSTTRFTDVRGKVNAVQAKSEVWNLGVSFSHLTPGALYRLWGNRVGATPVQGDISGFFPIGTATALDDGTAKFSYQTDDPTNLGFDLNILPTPDTWNGITIVTSYWSEQWLQVLNPDGSLYVPS